ncbi:efflux RND transporter periplasmic adaptor subunit [Saccharophagus degradans]|uniref:Efflux RND transporter periplasmic adaptor subunit n=1 Tax=Saccharophagus degradans TaxID=86304 RepID=A0AAW7XCB1_9GAMM|nr:efflux RND transporter periplasmic adaptor subunit [Saccharophagus degradans]MDO6424168.1 efflux RND transporter periplasmic adaptor subunit [Saccharophagus degradans]MDO6608215.1 efflux RND transporter periplasmic adaptor subunit [Saccharophagus degradans]
MTGQSEAQPSKSELLQQLKIDKQAPAPAGFSGKQLIATGVVCALLAGGLTYLLAPTSPSAVNQKATGAISQAKASVNTVKDSTANTGKSGSEKSGSSSKSIYADKTEVLNASGYVTPRLIATVSAETMGLIKSVQVEEGMKVEKGQVLATLDDAVAQVNLKLAQAQLNAQLARLESMQTDLDESNRVLKRVKQMALSGFSSDAEITRAQTNVDKLSSGLTSAIADVEVARMQYAAQKERVDDHIIRAPFSGVVTVKNAQPGEIVSPSAAGGYTRTGICTIVDMDSLQIEVDVNEAFIRKVVADQPVIANLDAYPNWDIPARVIAIIPAADRAKATVRVRIRIDEKDERILPDMGVKVTLFEKD